MLVNISMIVQLLTAVGFVFTPLLFACMKYCIIPPKCRC